VFLNRDYVTKSSYLQQQSSQWKNPSTSLQKKARQAHSSLKRTLVIFFCILGIVYYKFVAKVETVNQHFYSDLLRRLRENGRRKLSEKQRTGD
jgi:hypothetical protein